MPLSPVNSLVKYLNKCIEGYHSKYILENRLFYDKELFDLKPSVPSVNKVFIDWLTSIR